MTAPTRCKQCKHRRGPRVLVYAKRKGGVLAEPKQHKKPCHCDCHDQIARVAA